MRALLVAVIVALLAVAPPAAAQSQGGGNAFGPLPQEPAPAPTPVSTPDTSSGLGDTGRTTLFVIGGALLVTFIVIGRFIVRDARRHTPAGARTDGPMLREE